MPESKWQRKARALARLAEDQRGKPEGDLAREKLLEIINRHPEAAQFEPIVTLARRDITLKDVAQMHRDGVSTDGSWTGRNFQEALDLMQADYWARIEAHRNRRYLTDTEALND